MVQVTKFQIAMRVAWIFVATIFAKDANTKAGTLDRVVRRSQTQKSEDAEDSADVPELSNSGKRDSPGAHDLPTSGIAESSADSRDVTRDVTRDASRVQNSGVSENGGNAAELSRAGLAETSSDAKELPRSGQGIDKASPHGLKKSQPAKNDAGECELSDFDAKKNISDTNSQSGRANKSTGTKDLADSLLVKFQSFWTSEFRGLRAHNSAATQDLQKSSSAQKPANAKDSPKSQSANASTIELPEEELEAIHDELDMDKDGKVSPAELWMATCSACPERKARKALRKLSKDADQDKDGYISNSELKSFLVASHDLVGKFKADVSYEDEDKNKVKDEEDQEDTTDEEDTEDTDDEEEHDASGEGDPVPKEASDEDSDENSVEGENEGANEEEEAKGEDEESTEK